MKVRQQTRETTRALDRIALKNFAAGMALDRAYREAADELNADLREKSLSRDRKRGYFATAGAKEG